MTQLEPAGMAMLLLKASGGRVEGRTVFQKLAYFMSVKLGVSLGFSPYFYGPFSRDLEKSMELLVLSGRVAENTTVLGTSAVGWPVRQTHYELTSDGRSAAEQFANEHSKAMATAEEIVSKTSQGAAGPSQKQLSLGAKVHFILAAKGIQMTPEEVALQSQQLGWQLQSTDVDRCVGLLQELELV